MNPVDKMPAYKTYPTIHFICPTCLVKKEAKEQKAVNLFKKLHKKYCDFPDDKGVRTTNHIDADKSPKLRPFVFYEKN